MSAYQCRSCGAQIGTGWIDSSLTSENVCKACKTQERIAVALERIAWALEDHALAPPAPTGSGAGARPGEETEKP